MVETLKTLPLSWTSRVSKICDSVEKALISEASTHPKPGLVTRFSHGSHADMSFSTFSDSAKSISTVFMEELSYVLELTLSDHNELAIEALREVGRKAEFAMYRCTNGVNTPQGRNLPTAYDNLWHISWSPELCSSYQECKEVLLYANSCRWF